MTSEILRRSSNGNGRIVDLQTKLAPVGQGIQVHTAVDESLGEITTTGLQRVGTNNQRTIALVGLQPLQALLGGEHVEEVLDQLLIVAKNEKMK